MKHLDVNMAGPVLPNAARINTPDRSQLRRSGRTSSTARVYQAILAWAAMLIVLPAIAQGQPATGSSASCTNRFPYGPENFLEKLLIVANESDAAAVPATFQRVFDTKLRKAPTTGNSKTFSYEATSCEWYARILIIWTRDENLSAGIPAFLRIGNLAKPLLFDGPLRDNCLSVELADRSLKSSGWKGGITAEADAAMWVYAKSQAELTIFVTGSANLGMRCVSELSLIYR